MELIGDLSEERLAALLPDRAIRSYPALLSTEADAQAWARAGAPAGAVVVAEYQASPRGRGGIEWRPEPGHSLAFTLVVRPQLPGHRGGWLYTTAASALADVGGAEIEWPDEAVGFGRVGVHVEETAGAVAWAVINVLVDEAEPPRGELVARIVAALEARLAQPTAPVLADYLRRCATLGRPVRARLVPLGPAGTTIEGVARTALADGALVIETAEGRRVAVTPGGLGVLEPLT